MGEPPDRLLATTASKPAVQIVRKVITAQSRYWNCMYPKAPQREELWTDRVHGTMMFVVGNIPKILTSA
jgi:histone deacetylase 6